jgi:2-dehydropantoate 2-reductase
MFLSPLSGLCAAMRRPTTAVWHDPFARELFLAGAREVEAVALAEGVPIPPDATDRIIRYVDTLPPSMTPSLLIDLSAGRRLELETLQGAVVRRGRRHGVPTPILDTLYAVLKPHAGGAA